jgi:hypothetical protein
MQKQGKSVHGVTVCHTGHQQSRRLGNHERRPTAKPNERKDVEKLSDMRNNVLATDLTERAKTRVVLLKEMPIGKKSREDQQAVLEVWFTNCRQEKQIVWRLR